MLDRRVLGYGVVGVLGLTLPLRAALHQHVLQLLRDQPISRFVLADHGLLAEVAQSTSKILRVGVRPPGSHLEATVQVTAKWRFANEAGEGCNDY